MKVKIKYGEGLRKTSFKKINTEELRVKIFAFWGVTTVEFKPETWQN